MPLPIWLIHPHSHLKTQIIIGALNKMNYCDPAFGYDPATGVQCFPVTPIDRLTSEAFQALINEKGEVLVWEYNYTSKAPGDQFPVHFWSYKKYATDNWRIKEGSPCAYGHTLRYRGGKGNCVACAKAKHHQNAEPYLYEPTPTTFSLDDLQAYVSSNRQKGKAQKARVAGQKTYLGKPCKLGHFERYASTSQCVECARARQRKNIQNPFGL